MVRLAVIGLILTGLPVQRAGAADRGIEHLTVLGPDGSVLVEIDGHAASVVLSPELDQILYRDGAHLTLIHNHPQGTGLSAADLVQLTKPGVATIVAIGPDGTRYEAGRGPRFDVKHFETLQYKTALEQVLRGLVVQQAQPGAAGLESFTAHLVCAAMERAGVLDYRFTLDGELAHKWQRWGPVLRFVIGIAAEEVQKRSPGSLLER